MEIICNKSLLITSIARRQYSKCIHTIPRLFFATTTVDVTTSSRQRISSERQDCTPDYDCTNCGGHEIVVPNYISSTNEEALATILKGVVVFEDFISEREEKCFLDELEPYMRRLRYEFNHWDDAIHGYRETEKSSWNASNRDILHRVANIAFAPKDKLLKHIHVLDISKDGYIKPHIDSVRFCGDTIAGLSLLSSSIMRLVCENDQEKVVDILLKQRSLYVMKGEARYKYTHEILQQSMSIFKGMQVNRDRRLSIISRNEPTLQSEIQ